MNKNESRWRELLVVADEGAKPLVPRANLGQRVRGLVARRTRNRRLAAMTTALFMGAFSLWYVSPRAAPRALGRLTDTWEKNAQPAAENAEPTKIDSETTLREIEGLRRRADALRDAAKLLQAQRNCGQILADLEMLLDADNPVLLAERESERAAHALVYRAERAQDFQAARSEYQRTIALFPATVWATVARERLVALTGEM